MFDDLNDDNFLLYAIKCYSKPNAIMSEFEEDLNRIQYIKRLITKYRDSGEFKGRLILNHITVLYNVFGVEGATRILFFKLDEKDYEIIKPFLLFLSYMPIVVRGIRGKNYLSAQIEMDEEAVKCLKQLQ
jgi:hypothetical protein